MNKKMRKFLEDLRVEVQWSQYQSNKHGIETIVLFDAKNLISVAMPFKDFVEGAKQDKDFLKRNGLQKLKEATRHSSHD